MFTEFLLTGIVGLAIIACCEVFIRKNKLKGENARKLVHITIALYASTWAFYLSPLLIALISVILIGAVIVVQKYNILHSMRSVRRVTYGEIWYPVGIGISALLFHNPYVYAIAILHMGLADGLAAVVGMGMGKHARKFKVAGMTKSLAGTLVFITTSFIVYFAYWVLFSNQTFFQESILYAAIISISSAILVAMTELLSPKGSDNVIVPVVAGLFAILPTLQLII